MYIAKTLSFGFAKIPSSCDTARETFLSFGCLVCHRCGLRFDGGGERKQGLGKVPMPVAKDGGREAKKVVCTKMDVIQRVLHHFGA